MKAWVKKDDCLESCKSLWVKAWLHQFNVWVPGHLQTTPLEGERYYVRFHPPPPAPTIQLIVPAQSIMIDHPFFRHSVSIRLWRAFQEENAGRKRAAAAGGR